MFLLKPILCILNRIKNKIRTDLGIGVQIPWINPRTW